MASTEIAEIDDKQLIQTLKNSLYPGASDASVQMVLDYCRARHLDPFLHPVHIVPMYDSKLKANRDVIIPGLNLYRTQAAESGRLAGISEPEFGDPITFTYGGRDMSAPEWCRVTVKRLLKTGYVAEFTAVEYFTESCAVSKEGIPTPMWRKRPRGMLAKCAESQALRKAFPDICPDRTAEEVEGHDIDPDAPDIVDESQIQSPEERELAQLAFAAANEGSESYKAFWQSLTKEQKQQVRALYPKGLSEVAKEADAMNADTTE